MIARDRNFLPASANLMRTATRVPYSNPTTGRGFCVGDLVMPDDVPAVHQDAVPPAQVRD